MSLCFEAGSAVLGLLGFVRRIEKLSNAQLLTTFHQIAESAVSQKEATADEIIDMHRRFATEVRSFLSRTYPSLLFLINDSSSAKAETAVKEIASEKFLEDALLSAGVEEWNDPADAAMKQAIEVIKWRLQIAVANDVMSIESAKSYLKSQIKAVIGTGSNKIAKLNQNHGREIASRLSSECRCPPLTRA
jgi:hypothetical protein